MRVDVVLAAILLLAGEAAVIAEALVVSTGTAKTHVANVFSKLRLRDRAQAVVFAYESGLIRPGDAQM
jgi:DNA-binding NarL/FixJ family response regulator